MKTGRYFALCALLVLGLAGLTGCAGGNRRAANEITLSLEGITRLTISYDEEAVTFFEGTGDTLVIREYMTEYDGRYGARVSRRGDSIQISEGGKPLFRGNFSRYVEVCLPADWGQSLTVTTTEGEIDLTGMGLELSELRVDSTAGRVCLGSVLAPVINLSTTSGSLEADSLMGDEIQLETTSGSIDCEAVEGHVRCVTTSGDVKVAAARGWGSYRAENSGTLEVSYAQVTGGLSFYNKNGDVKLNLPAGLDFSFSIATKNGTVATSFQERLKLDGGTAYGEVGTDPQADISVETKNGNIQVTQG